jgi:hypothetical protein
MCAKAVKVKDSSKLQWMEGAVDDEQQCDVDVRFVSPFISFIAISVFQTQNPKSHAGAKRIRGDAKHHSFRDPLNDAYYTLHVYI